MADIKEELNQLKYWAQCAIKISNEISPHLNMSNEIYQSRSNHVLIMSNPKGFYLFGVLDEIAKVGTAMFRWIEFISGEDIIDSRSFLARNIIQAVYDEQQMWGRKLLEALTDLILFQETNEAAYYQHFLLLNELKDIINAYDDYKEFYGKPSENLDFQRSIWLNSIAKCESQIELSHSWYINKNERKLISQVRKPSKIMQSFRQKLMIALPKTNAREKLALGLSYRMYSELSGFIHFNSDRDKGFPDEDDIKFNMSRVWYIVICIVNRLQQLIGNKPRGEFSDEFNLLINLPSNENDLMLRVTGNFFSIGDIVLLENDELCMIEEIHTSLYGYKVFRLNYLQHKTRPEPYDEWLPGNMLRPIFKIRDIDAAIGKDNNVSDFLKGFSKEEIYRHYGVLFAQSWNTGLKEYLLKGDMNALIKSLKKSTRL